MCITPRKSYFDAIVILFLPDKSESEEIIPIMTLKKIENDIKPGPV